MTFEEKGKKSFTFTWKLENASYCFERKGEKIKSPAFVVDSIDETKWKLGFYPRGAEHGDYIAFNLFREADSKGPARVEIYYELAFIAKDGSVLKSYTPPKHVFLKGEGMGINKFETREEVFTTKRSAFLPRDILTARCRIWKSFGVMPLDIQCFARTRIGVEKRIFLWKLQNFNSLESEKKYTHWMKSLANGTPLMTLDLLMTGDLNSEEIIRFQVKPEDRVIKFSTLRLSLVDTSGNRIDCNQDAFWFDDAPKCQQFTFFFTKKKLMAKKSLYLPDGILSLHWEWTFSKGIVLEEIEKIQNGCSTFENKTSNGQNVKDQKMVPLSHTLNGYLKSVYDEHFLSDVKLKTSTGLFPAHKVILGASSSVFKAMFSNNMEEKDSDCVNIEDLSDDAISRMLLFIYTARLEDLTWESASNLYVAADKYAILGLKDICSSYLKDNLSPSNACEILLVADFHADGDLKSVVQDFILKHDEKIVNSDEWKLLMETNIKLAAETLCLRYK
ncbi:unnamed protein product [Larinioides sclopetarius]|uniref:Speckle-type POZ protein n=1 Tax=Larinioides sclopetarius TaxID=280406 RepID=A0AAV2BJ48_9ARAC